MSKGEIVILCTSATQLSNGHPTGVWAEEVAAPYYVFKNAGYKVTIASPNGGKVTIDKVSLQGEAVTPDTKKWLDDETAQNELNNSAPISQIKAESITALYAAGGHGAVVDFPNSTVIANLVKELYTSGKVVASVCHGAEIFKNAKDQNGEPIVKGKKITGFSDAEEKTLGDDMQGIDAPETILRNLGASYGKASEQWGSHVEVDTSGSGPIVTGQNPASSEASAEETLKYIKTDTA